MNRDDLDPQLGELLRDAVSGIEPSERLGELRARTSAPSRRRPALLALGGAVLASAAVVTAVAVTGTDLLSSSEPGPAGSSTTTTQPSEDPTETATESSPAVAVRAVAAYYLGDTPAGPRLFREFTSVTAPDDGPGASLDLLTATPQDPDYRTLWPAGAFETGSVEDDRITVELSDTALVDRPTGMAEEEAGLSVQQAVYTLQAYAQQRLPVEFTVAGEPVDRVLGVPVQGPVAAASPLQVLSLVNLTEPEEGLTVQDKLSVHGVANSNEANVPWVLEDASGEDVAEGYFMAEGWMAERLFPFSGTIDVSSLPSGSYTLVVLTDDASGGAEGPGAFSDSRTIVVD